MKTVASPPPSAWSPAKAATRRGPRSVLPAWTDNRRSRTAAGILRWLVVLLVVLNFGLAVGPHMTHPEAPHEAATRVVAETSSADQVSTEGTLLHVFFGHGFSAHASAHLLPAPTLPGLGLRDLPADVRWPLNRGRVSPFGKTIPLLRPPRI